jgi:hypothetical protein
MSSELAQWLSDLQGKGCLWFLKRLSANDTQDNGSHQAGLLPCLLMGTRTGNGMTIHTSARRWYPPGHEILRLDNVDGVLAGSASLQAESFSRIVQA